MTVLVTGGSKSGKSKYAEGLFTLFEGEKYYIAAMKPYGEEALISIERHRKMRLGKGFKTIEKYTDLEELRFAESAGVLIECIGNLCANEMFFDNCIKYPADKIVSAVKKISKAVDLLVIVSNEISCDGIEYPPETMKYIMCMGDINRCIAEFADSVVECVFGIPVSVKGKLL